MSQILSIFDAPIAFHRCFVPFAGVKGAVLLSQMVYWQKRAKQDDGFFYKTAEEWEEETGLTTKEQFTARKILLECGAIYEVKRGVPCKLYYKINEQKLSDLVRETAKNSSFPQTAKLVSPKAENKFRPNGETITEITTETTTKDSLSTLKTTTESDFSKSANQRERDSFELFFSKYPKKTSREKAFEYWLQMQPEDRILVNRVIDTYLQLNKNLKHHKEAVNFLRDEMYKDESLRQTTNQISATIEKLSGDYLQKAKEREREASSRLTMFQKAELVKDDFETISEYQKQSYIEKARKNKFIAGNYDSVLQMAMNYFYDDVQQQKAV